MDTLDSIVPEAFKPMKEVDRMVLKSLVDQVTGPYMPYSMYQKRMEGIIAWIDDYAARQVLADDKKDDQ